MKILQVITALGAGGAEKLMVDIIPLLKKRGCNVDILLFNGKDTPFKAQLQQQGVNIFQLSKNGYTYNPLFILKLIKYLKQYDIIHTHLTSEKYFVALAKLLFHSRCHLVMTEHSTYNRRRHIWYFKLIDKFIYNKYEKVICISDQTKNNLMKYLDLRIANNFITIENGINLNTYISSEPYNKKDLVNIANNDILIVQIATFRKAKDQDTVIRAVSMLPDNFHLALVGDGERRTECENLAIELNAKNRIHFLGTRTDVPQILKTSDIVVMSSHWEGFGLAAVEGMAAGKPVIASDVPGLHEVVSDAGVLFEHENTEQLTEIIKELSINKMLYSQTVEKCKRRAMQYDIEKMVDGYENVYKELCKNFSS